MKSLLEISIFSQLPDDIINIIYNLHNIHYSIYLKNIKLVHNQLITNFTCCYCQDRKHYFYFYISDYCCVDCEYKASKYNDYIANEKEEQIYYNQIFNEYIEEL